MASFCNNNSLLLREIDSVRKFCWQNTTPNELLKKVHKRLFSAPPLSWSWLSSPPVVIAEDASASVAGGLLHSERRKGRLWEKGLQPDASVSTHQVWRADTTMSIMSPKGIPHPAQPGWEVCAGTIPILQCPPALCAGCTAQAGPLMLSSSGVHKENKSQQCHSPATSAAHSRRGLIKMQSILYFWPTYRKQLSDTSIIPGIINLPQLPDSCICHVSQLCKRKALCMQIIYLSSL